MRNQVICEAIETRHVLSFTYDNVARTVEPHAHGEDYDGDSSLRAWQLTGTGRGWRMFHIDKMSGLSITGQSFAGTRPRYNPNDKDLRTTYCRL